MKPITFPSGVHPILLTPGPLTTSDGVREAMLRDWASRDDDFRALTAVVRRRLHAVSGLSTAYTSVPLQGSGTFALEACIETLLGPDQHVVILENGAYGKRLAELCRRLGKRHTVLSAPERQPLPAARLADLLRREPAIRHVLSVHCETSSGMLNDPGPILDALSGTGCRLILDAMSTFGAIPIPMHPALLAVVSSSNKCLEGAPGVAFVIVEIDALERNSHRSRSLSLDLLDQYRVFEATGEWRFTPPTHVVAALAQALCEHEDEGGVLARGRRYRQNYEVVVRGVTRLGIAEFLPRELQSPIIVCFEQPALPGFEFSQFYSAVRARGFILYPGKLAGVSTFRVGCIGRILPGDLERAVAAIALSVSSASPGDG